MSTQAIATAKEVFDLLRDDLSAIENELVRDAVSNVGAITDIADHLREGGGKRIRPSLLLLAAKSLGYQGHGMVRLGAVVEMVHTATLVHDDIIDGADTRRGRPSANTTWGNSKCVLAGDWLYMQAFHIALEERNFKVLDLLIGLTQQMVEGEFVQMEKLGQHGRRSRILRPDLPQDRVPVRRLHAPGRGSGRSVRRDGRADGRVRPQPGHRLPDRGRRAGPDRHRAGVG